MPPASENPKPDTGIAPNPERWVEEHGDYLFRFARARVRDASRAEDLVQEAFLAALKNRETFSGRSSERTWLTGILRNKILDHYRRSGRETSFTDLGFLEDDERGSFVASGFSKGTWRAEAGPSEWSPTPGAELDQEVFWRVFWTCVEGVPERVAQVFLLREMDEVKSEEICATLNIKPNHLWVMLHRARMALRRCLERNWHR